MEFFYYCLWYDTTYQNPEHGTSLCTRRVSLITRVVFDEQHKAAWQNLPEDEKMRFMRDLQILLLQINLLYNIKINTQEIDNVELKRHIFFDGLTKDIFYDCVVSVLRGLQAIVLVYKSLSYKHR
jgi:hypothetical protein